MSGTKQAFDTIVVAIKVDRADHELLQELARKNERTLSGEIRVAIREYLSKIK